MRYAVVDRQFDALGIDHQELHLVGRRAHEQRCNDGVQANRFSGTGRAGNEEMRHSAKIAENRTAGDIFTERHPERRNLSAIGKRFENLANRDDRNGLVGTSMPMADLPESCFNAHRSRRQGQREIVGKRCDARNLDAAFPVSS